MHPLRLQFSPLTLSAAGYANDVAWAGGGYALTATTVGDGLAHVVSILGNAAVDHSLKTFTVTGTSADGVTISEGIAGPNGVATVITTRYFKTVTSVTVSATTGADTFDIGWTAAAVSQTVMMDWRKVDFQVALSVIITGTISVTVQHTLDALHGEYLATAGAEYASWMPHSTIASKTASTDGNYAYPIVATRLLIVSVTNGATVGFQVVQQ
tara:strand:- start:4499 stop:5134 length:636 start_codon:yes stop_codon:yes gene_type:complete